MDLADVHRTFHPNTEEDIFFSEAHGAFSKIYIILGDIVSLNKYKKLK